MKTLYIHIGTPKTGTSAIQDFLDKNSSRLKEKGYLYRRMELKDFDRNMATVDEEGNLCFRLFSRTMGTVGKKRNGFFLHGDRGVLPEDNLQILQKGLEEVKAWFAESEKIILTDEGVWTDFESWDYGRRIKEFTDQNEILVKIIVYLRPQADYLDSFYRSRVKWKYQSEDWETYLSEEALMDYFGVDYERRLRAIADVFGKENTLVRPYEPALWKTQGKDLFSDFAEALGISDISGCALPEALVNESLSYNQAEIKRLINGMAGENDSTLSGYTKLTRNASLLCSELNEDEVRYSYFSAEEKESFMQRFEEGNRRVAREYLNREELFLSPPRIFPKWEKDPLSMEEDIVLYFGAVTRRLYEEINRLKKENKELERHSLGNRLHRFFARIKNRLRGKKASGSERGAF